MLRRALFLGLLAGILAPAALASSGPRLERTLAVADTVRDQDPVQIRPRFVPTSLYSGTRGLGIEGGVAIDNVGWEGSLVAVDGRLSQRYQRAGVTLYTGNPYEHRVFAGVSGTVRTTTRRRFYGIGPLAMRDAKLSLDYSSGEVETRAGWYPFGHTGLLVQPSARLLWDRLDGIAEDSENRPELVDDASLDNLARVQGEDRYGVALGLSLSTDTRDGRILATQGVLAQLEAKRFFALDGSDLAYNQVLGSVYGFAPLSRNRSYSLIGRVVAGVTRSDDGAELPFFYLPTLDDALLSAYPGDRFLGRDLLTVAGGIRFPVVRGFGLFELNGLLMATVGSTYTDIADEFSPSISFDRDIVVDDNGRVPLRPALVVGLGLINLDRQRISVGGKMGIGPEGLIFTGLNLVYDLRDTTSLFR